MLEYSLFLSHSHTLYQCFFFIRDETFNEKSKQLFYGFSPHIKKIGNLCENTVFINYFLLVAKFNLFDKQMFCPQTTIHTHTHSHAKKYKTIQQNKLNKFEGKLGEVLLLLFLKRKTS